MHLLFALLALYQNLIIKFHSFHIQVNHFIQYSKNAFKGFKLYNVYTFVQVAIHSCNQSLSNSRRKEDMRIKLQAVNLHICMNTLKIVTLLLSTKGEDIFTKMAFCLITLSNWTNVIIITATTSWIVYSIHVNFETMFNLCLSVCRFSLRQLLRHNGGARSTVSLI